MHDAPVPGARAAGDGDGAGLAGAAALERALDDRMVLRDHDVGELERAQLVQAVAEDLAQARIRVDHAAPFHHVDADDRLLDERAVMALGLQQQLLGAHPLGHVLGDAVDDLAPPALAHRSAHAQVQDPAVATLDAIGRGDGVGIAGIAPAPVLEHARAVFLQHQVDRLHLAQLVERVSEPFAQPRIGVGEASVVDDVDAGDRLLDQRAEAALGVLEVGRAFVEEPRELAAARLLGAQQHPQLEDVVHARDELRHADGLADEVLGAGLERAFHVIGLGGHHDDGQIALRIDRLQRRHHLEAVHPGHEHVQDHEVVAVLAMQLRHRERIGRGGDAGIARAREHRRDEPRVGLLVVGDQDARVEDVLRSGHALPPSLVACCEAVGRMQYPVSSPQSL